jgi:probable rRNA maturation factor
MIYIDIADSLQPPAPDAALVPQNATALLEAAVRAALTHQNETADQDLSIVLDVDQQLRELNLQFLGNDAPTDVLSFPSDETDPETGVHYLGDIIISLPRAAAQAGAAGHSLQAELQLLTVHGVLHLLEYDHLEPDQKARMWAAQAEILAALGLPDIAPPDNGPDMVG